VSRGVSAEIALQRLRDGNARFAANARGAGTLITAARRAKLTAAQEPFAIVLGCSDSRVPVELVFNQGPGDLFVIRVAGNIVAPSLIGSVEFAADRFGTRLVVVLGHSSCGAIQATIEELHRPTVNQSPNLKAIVDRIRPGVERLVQEARADDGALAVEHAAMTANVRASVEQLRHGSAIIENLIANDGLVVTGAWYSLETGKVKFLDETLSG
jgi:carbonic anhydrase